jgi:hypothetical protein
MHMRNVQILANTFAGFAAQNFTTSGTLDGFEDGIGVPGPPPCIGDLDGRADGFRDGFGDLDGLADGLADGFADGTSVTFRNDGF